MFGKPCPLPSGANIMPLLWTYHIKMDGTKRSEVEKKCYPLVRAIVTLRPHLDQYQHVAHDDG